MAGQKFLQLTATGGLKETIATQGGGAPDADKIPALDAAGRLPLPMMPTGVGPDTQPLLASEALGAGALVNIWEDSGTAKMRKADATTAGKEADAFVVEAVALGAMGTAYFEGNDEHVAGLIPGRPVFLSTTAGGITQTPPTDPGNVVQRVGKATTATSFNFEPAVGVERA